MDVLEILEEIKQYTKDVYECDLDDIVEYQRRNREDKCTYIVQGIEEATEFIRSYMDDGKDINVLSNVGWIPVEERLPKDGQEVLVWYEYFRYGEYNRMFETYGIGWQFDGHWSGDVSGTKARCIAWQPLPEPYRPKGIPRAKNTQQEMEDFWRDK